MKIHCYNIYDNQVDAFPDSPFFARSNGEAIRAFTDAANDPNSNVGKHPEDYVLFYISTFDPENGAMIQEATGAKRLITGLDVIARSK